MPTPPVRFQVEPGVQSPIRWDSFSGLSPTESDPSEDSGPSEKSESVDSPPVPEHVTVAEEEDVAMTEADMERNADFFLEQVCDEAGMLKEDFFEEAKDSGKVLKEEARRKLIVLGWACDFLCTGLSDEKAMFLLF